MPKYRVVKAGTLFMKDRRYTKNKVCKVRKRNANKKITGYQEFEVYLEKPIEISSFKVYFEKTKIWVSGCTIPATHLKDLIPCQDRFKIMTHDDTLFLVIFDGYGIAGHKISEICIEESENFFFDHFLSKSQTHSDFLNRVVKHLDQVITFSNNNKISSSGCSAILCLVCEGVISIAHLGDTRAIKAQITDDKKYGKGSLICQKLTEEHKPEHVEEFARITLTGARVQKLVDINGQHKGPYRVWESSRNTLGLKISRGLGNSVAKGCGIIAEPFIHSCALHAENDNFIVIGSAGIWEVFDNQEIINFVEAYRRFCIKGLDVPPNDEEISYINTCIAQLVCEEARLKWLYKLEDEDVHMDDLSCIIIELKLPSIHTGVINDVSLIAENLDDSKMNESKKAPTLKDTIVKESRRISVIGVSILNSKTEMP